MLQTERLRIAIQKSGRLHENSIELLNRCGIKFHFSKNALLLHAENLPIDILLVRDDDIPTLVMDDICDLGIVGENILLEKKLYKLNNGDNPNFTIVNKLDSSRCRLAIAVPEDREFIDVSSLQGLRIATSYPNLLQQFLDEQQINAEILNISGSVEIAPRLGMADAICDLVSTGRTLEENNLTEVYTLIQSQAVLIQTNKKLKDNKEKIKSLLLQRVLGVLKAKESKYIMFHAPKKSLNDLKSLLPGFETPTIMPLEGIQDRVAVHVVSTEGVFWETVEKLKQAGANSILVLPIEKMMN